MASSTSFTLPFFLLLPFILSLQGKFNHHHHHYLLHFFFLLNIPFLGFHNYLKTPCLYIQFHPRSSLKTATRWPQSSTVTSSKSILIPCSLNMDRPIFSFSILLVVFSTLYSFQYPKVASFFFFFFLGLGVSLKWLTYVFRYFK